MRKRWILPEAAPDEVLAVAEALGISEPVARVLVARGYRTPGDAAAFLGADTEVLENPFLMAGMDRAVGRIQMARARGEKVFVAGDRDVDGVTSTTLLQDLLTTLGLASSWKVPTPEAGYGLSLSAVEAAAVCGATLILAVDCGIRDFEGVEAAHQRGIDVVILDHHEPAETLPRAYAVVDPKRVDCAYPWKHLCACAVAFKFAQAVFLAEDEELAGRDLVVFDVETTGGTERDEIVEIGAVKLRNGVEIGRFCSLIRPTVPIAAAVTRIHGITESMVADAPEAAVVIGSFLEFLGDAAIVAHNAAFDIRFLRAAAARAGLDVPRLTVLDTLPMARQLMPGEDHSLGALAARFKVPLADAHRALPDALATAGVLRRLWSLRCRPLQDFLKRNLDLVSMATLADVMPLRNENRVLVRRGLEALSRSTRPGVVALREAFLRSPAITAKDVAWSLAPAVNAAGRLGEAIVAAELLMSPDLETARPLAARLASLNDRRKELVKVNLDAVAGILARDYRPDRDAAAVLTVSGIEHGVTGIVANRLMHEIGRPVVLLIEDEGEVWKGTSRSIPALDLTRAFRELSDLIAHFGGHSGAAGISLRPENVSAFRERFNAYVRETVSEEDLVPRVAIDAELRPGEVNDRLLAELARLEPTGHGNETPVFCVRRIAVAEARRMGEDGRHLKLALARDGARIEAVQWNAGPGGPDAGDDVDVAFTIERNEWMGRARIQCLMVDWRPAA